MSKTIVTNRSVGKQALTGNKESTRVELAACAALFFAKQGYYGTSTQTIAEYCNIRKASLFHHYKTKEEIALAAIQYVRNECDKNIFKIAEDNTVSPKQRALNFLHAAEQFFTQRIESLLPTLLGLELSDIDLFAKAIENYFQAWQVVLSTILTPLCEDPTKAQQLAQQTLIRIQGHLVTARIQQNPQHITNLFKELREPWLESAKVSA
jgi:TetR/AcrR family transcriptional repressor of nem operon